MPKNYLKNWSFWAEEMELQILHAGISHPSPYFHNFCNALRENHPEIDLSINPEIPPNGPTEEGVLHFHRLKRFYSSDAMKSASNFITNLNKAKKVGWKIAWTIHNFFPIDREISEVDFWVTEQFSRLSDVIFTHTDLMKKNAERIFSRRVINHSCGVNQLAGIFDANRTGATRGDYETTFTFGGNIAGYKCVPQSIEAFKRLKKEFPYKRLRFIVAGPSSRGIDLKKSLEGDLDITRYNFFVGDGAWKELCDVTDVFLTPYEVSLPAFKYGFFPSSVPQLLGYKKPMILPDCPETREFLPEKNMAIFYGKEGLYPAMREGLDFSRRKSVQKHLEGIVSNFSWDEVVKVAVEGYRSTLE
jgi:glycosyltransferase involved in cell wall biosynthesis